MIIPHSLAGKKVAILGLGKSGLFAAKALNRIGAKFVAWDDEKKTRDPVSYTHLTLPTTPYV